MTSRRLARASALLILLAGPVAAQEVGARVEFPAPAPTFGALLQPIAQRSQAPRYAYESGDSAQVQETWDTVLFHGLIESPAATFEAARETPSGWTDWIPADVSRRGKTGRFWGRVRFDYAGPGAVRLRASVPSGGKARVKVLGVEVFHSRDHEGGGAVLQLAPGAPGRLPLDLVTRVAWRARAPKEPYEPLGPAVKITLHHTDGLQTSTLADSEEEVRFIQDFHMNGRGWSDIAYHFLVDAAGNVFEGRPENVLGAHTKFNNPGNIGIALLGTYERPKNDRITPAQQAAVAALGRYLVAKYGIDPATLKGHRDYRPTTCPGDLAYARLPELRRLFGERPLAATLGVGAGKAFAVPAVPAFDGR